MARLDDERRSNPFAAPESDFEPDLMDRDHQNLIREGPVVYGTFSQRLGAMMVDWILIYIIILVLCSFLLALLQGGYSRNDSNSKQQLFGFLCYLVALTVGLVFYALFESSPMQATPGKKIFGFKVTDLKGNQISFFRAAGRFFGKFLSGPFFCLGYLVQPFTQRKQAWHDSLAGTLVVKG